MHTKRDITLVMWTSTRTDMSDINLIPNHFVPILPLLATNVPLGQAPLDPGSDDDQLHLSLDDSLEQAALVMEFDDDQQDLSLNDSLLNQF